MPCHPFAVYCPWPGLLGNGTIFLVGAMGSYEYFSYIKTVVQDRQIRYECNKGFFLHGGPSGATCVDGNWSPTGMPKCYPGRPHYVWLSVNKLPSETVQRYLTKSQGLARMHSSVFFLARAVSLITSVNRPYILLGTSVPCSNSHTVFNKQSDSYKVSCIPYSW